MKVVIDIPKDFEGDYIVDKFKDFFSRVIADIDCNGMCGRYEKEIAEMFLKAFDDSEEKEITKMEESVSVAESKVQKIKVTGLDIIVEFIGGKPYYEIKYHEVGSDHFCIGYGSYSLDIVAGYRDTYFEIVKNTNGDLLRSMSDEKLAKWIHNATEFMDGDNMYKSFYNFDTGREEKVRDKYDSILAYLQSEHEGRN